MAEYNEVTKKLLKEGYTADNYPDYVCIGSSRLPGNDPLNNLYGGFEYKRWYSDGIIYKTGCGKYAMGKNVFAGMSCAGVDWCHENNNPVIRCPYNISDCPDNDSRLHGTFCGGICWCVCHRTDIAYDFENSIEKEYKQLEKEKEEKYKEFAGSRNGRVCRNHAYYDTVTKKWDLRYEPRRCAAICYSQDGYCPILGKQLSKKRGNVYYDIKTSGVIQQSGSQYSLFDGKPWAHIRKGVRYFKSPCSMDICEAFVKVQGDEIRRNYEMNHSTVKMVDPSWQFEILNIRAESKPSRDLAQDLEDIRAGMLITFDNECEKQKKQRKKEERAKAKQKRIEKLEKKIITVGYENFEGHSLDKIHADKWLTKERLGELEEMRQQKIKEEQNTPVQLNLFEMM